MYVVTVLLGLLHAYIYISNQVQQLQNSMSTAGCTSSHLKTSHDFLLRMPPMASVV